MGALGLIVLIIITGVYGVLKDQGEDRLPLRQHATRGG
jgi:hypothetical protein